MKLSYLKILLWNVLLFAVVVAPFYFKVDLPLWKLDFGQGSKILWQNYDGPNYLIISKTWYDKEQILNKFSNPLPAEYYPAHFPLYPAIIWVFDLFVKGPQAMLLATLLGGILSSMMLFKYLSDFKISNQALWLVGLSLVFPFRVLALKSVGSPEPWFVLFILAAIWSFRKEKFWWAGIWGYLAFLTKSPGILLTAAFGVVALMDSIKSKRVQWKYLPSALGILGIPDLFYFYQLRTGNFWAYFQSGDNFHLFWPPFSIFAPQGQYWVGNFWLEDILWIWTFYGLGVAKLWKKDLRVESIFAGIFFISTLYVAHRDVSRYILPVAPFVIVGWSEYLQKREFKIIAAILLIPTLLFTWNFLLHNTAPIADWAPYL